MQGHEQGLPSALLAGSTLPAQWCQDYKPASELVLQTGFLAETHQLSGLAFRPAHPFQATILASWGHCEVSWGGEVRLDGEPDPPSFLLQGKGWGQWSYHAEAPGPSYWGSFSRLLGEASEGKG